MSNEFSELFKAMAEADGPKGIEAKLSNGHWACWCTWSQLLDHIIVNGAPWRLKPRTVEVSARGKTFHLPEPMREAPEIGQRYWCIDFRGNVVKVLWTDTGRENQRLAAGLCCATESDAQAWADFEWFARTGVE